MIISSNTCNEAALLELKPHQCKIVEQIILRQFLLNLDGYCNILLTRNFTAEIIDGNARQATLYKWSHYW